MSWIDAGSNTPSMNNRFISCKLGETATFTVKSIEKTTENEKFHPTSRKNGSQGFHLEITDTDGRIMSVGTFALQSKLQFLGRQDMDNPKGHLIGKRIMIKHAGEGEYSVAILAEPEPF